MAFVALAALASFWLRLRLDDLRAEKEAIAELRRAGARVQTTEADDWWLFVLPTAQRAELTHGTNAYLDAGFHAEDNHLQLVGKCRGLERLVVQSLDKITDDGLSACQGMRNLRIVSLSGCQMIGDQALACFSSAEGLEHLTIDGKRVTDHGLAVLKRFRQLKNLDIGATPVGDDGMQYVATCTALETLRLPLAVSDKGLARLAPLRSLRSLTLCTIDNISNDGLATVSAFEELGAFEIYGPGLTNSGAKHLCRCRNLRRIIVDGNALSDEMILGLAHLPRLRILNIGAGKMSHDRLRRLNAKAPHVDIF